MIIASNGNADVEPSRVPPVRHFGGELGVTLPCGERSATCCKQGGLHGNLGLQ